MVHAIVTGHADSNAAPGHHDRVLGTDQARHERKTVAKAETKNKGAHVGFGDIAELGQEPALSLIARAPLEGN
jgi:hypothetical protein